MSRHVDDGAHTTKEVTAIGLLCRDGRELIGDEASQTRLVPSSIRKCKYPGCERPHERGRGYCPAHHLRNKRGHPPMDQVIYGPGAKRPLEVRLSEKIAQGNLDDLRCWEWLGYISAKGYAIVMNEGRPHPVHRVLYELLIGPIPKGAQLLHWMGCKCVNPWHCAPGSDDQNKAQARIHRAAGRPMYSDPYEEEAA